MFPKKYADKIHLIVFSVDLPADKAGLYVHNPDDGYHRKVYDYVWDIIDKSTIPFKCAVGDKTTAWDEAEYVIVFELWNWNNEKELEVTMDWLRLRVEDAIKEVEEQYTLIKEPIEEE
jgi:hypothetical protein